MQYVLQGVEKYQRFRPGRTFVARYGGTDVHTAILAGAVQYFTAQYFTVQYFTVQYSVQTQTPAQIVKKVADYKGIVTVLYSYSCRVPGVQLQ